MAAQDGSAEAVVTRLLAAFNARDWPRLRALYHPQALLLLDHLPEPVGPERAVELLQREVRDHLYMFVPARIAQVQGEDAAIAFGNFRRRINGGSGGGSGYIAYQRHILYTVRDGLVYRARAFDSTASARAALAAHGPALGLASPAPSDGGAG